MAYPIYRGDMLSDVMRSFRGVFSPDADLSLAPSDTVVVPLEEERYVVITGAVSTPGRAPYTRSQTWRHFVSLAGGIDRERNVNDRVSITDNAGQRRAPEEPVRSGDTIHVHVNSPSRSIERILPMVTSGLGLLTTIIALISSLQ